MANSDSSAGRWWETGKTEDYNKYSNNIKAINDAVTRNEISEEDAAGLRKSVAERQFTPSSFDMGEFEGLLGRLESSKMKQQRQKSVEGRRDIMTGGLAGMMSNF